ncbi:hypothetical protein R5R35_014678 [Gryllus longicercus]|uniref:Unconventional myosin-Va n=1 Tax=Gryllus longicercus TaxID=2509291 RepID=A0AAN9Z4A2_9ORTH
MTTKELYTKGARIWIPHAEKVWEGAELLEDYKGKILRIQTNDDKEVKELTITTDDKLPPLRNPDILIGWNDLTSLSYLHEPAVLHNLRVRFERHNSIYTYCGIVLVAINPYSELPIYSTDTIFAYRGQAMGDLDPHIFAVAEEAYTKLEREQRDQSIIVSGESGAGKTVSAKYAMRYFATVGGSATETQVEKKVLASSPIMEAIGNAKTTRNDNSSRFGKFIEIHFSPQYHIQGASMRTYLLEKSRVVFQAPEERNYHIFYQLCAVRDSFPDLKLDRQDAFHYLNQGSCSGIQGVNDAKQFEETCSALSLLGFSEREQKDMWHILAAILHLGNVFITESVVEESDELDSECSVIAADDPHLVAFANLLQLDAMEMRSWLCQRRIVSLREAFLKPMTVVEAVSARDALAKHIYAELFNWIVAIVNKALQTSGSQQQRFIGVLDIYGFETFEINSFEQFCINYANEKLQQQFNQHVFKLEQEEYLKEDIAWKFIDFYDNQPCIDLIETRLGILDLLDEECKMPKGTDNSWVEKLYSKCSSFTHFARPRFGNSAFIVCHFADKVTYQSNGFLDKNKDTVIEEQINVIRNGQTKLIKKLFCKDESANKKLTVPAGRTKVSVNPKAATVGPAQRHHKKTVGSQFRDSLNMLMSTLNATTPHYVRCIKPNDVKAQVEYNPQRVVQQLRACGVLETIRISAAGFPSRWTYMEFFQRYRVLCRSSNIQRNNMKGTCEHILKNFIKDTDKYQFGRTKIFFRAGQVAYLEKLRADRRRACCIIIQKQVRAFVCRKRYLRIKRSVALLQRYGRGLLARRQAQYLRQTAAAITLQRHVRGWLYRVRYHKLRSVAVGLQRHGRGLLARRRYHLMKLNHSAIVIQRHIRGWLARRRYQKKRRHIVLVQCVVRRWLARRVLRRLKAEARSMEHIKKLNKGLENKIISLQQRIDELTKENGSLKLLQSENVELRSKVESLAATEVEWKKATILVNEQRAKLDLLEKELHQERDEKMDLINEKDRLEAEKKEEVQKLNVENLTLKEQRDKLNEEILISRAGAEELLKERLQKEKALLEREQDQDRNAYQKLLADYHLLETRAETAERELAQERRAARRLPARSGGASGGHQRSLSNASTASAQDLENVSALSEQTEDDYGYGSVRSTISTSSGTSGVNHISGRPAIENIDWTAGTRVSQSAVQAPASGSDTTSPEVSTPASGGGPAVEGVGLVLKLQQKVKELEKENDRLRRRVESLEKEDSPSDDLTRARDSFRVQELEMENEKLKSNIATLRIAAAEGSGSQELLSQFQALQAEHERQREECVQLRSVLASHTQGLKNVATNNYSSHVDIINEDGELVLAFEAQKKVTRQLEKELQDEQIRHVELQRDFECLREDYVKQRKLVSANLTRSPQSQTEAVMQHEIQRLTSENLDLQERYDDVSDQYRKAKKQVKLLTKKLNEAGIMEPLGESTLVASDGTGTAQHASGISPAHRVASTRGNTSGHPEGRPNLVQRKKERDYLGMFEYRKDDEAVIVKHLIHDLKPRVAITLLPGLPAYILFMCIRYTDHVNDDEKVRSLLTATINTVKKVIKKRHEDLDSTVLWLSNILRLLHNLKQYSGDKAFQAENTPKQNEQCLRNFDLAEYRQVLSDIVVWIYQGVIRYLEERVQPLVVPAILEHEAIAGVHQRAPGGMRGRLASADREAESPVDVQKALDALVMELSSINRCLALHGVDPELVVQVFRQLFYFICASALNNLLLRKDLCHWAKGMQIRYNLSYLEQWARDQKLQDPMVTDTLQPIVQASQLLQARKTEEDIQSLCDMCNQLSMFQIIKILNLYTPADDCEQRVPVPFIRKIQNKLQERQENSQQTTLLMDTKFSFPVRFPFNPSKIRLEDIEVPEVLNLPMLKKV